MAKNPYWFGKVVLVTGGSSGIGLAAARQLSAAGAHVWLAARRLPVLESALKEVLAARSDPSQQCGIISADVSDSGQARSVIDTVTRSAGAPDVVFNSAGITQPGYIQDLSLEVFEHLMQVNYLGTVYVTTAALPAMLARGSGHIINISSIAGYMGVFGYTAYGATKHGCTMPASTSGANIANHQHKAMTSCLWKSLWPLAMKTFIT